MGAFVSSENCAARHGIIVNCTVGRSENGSTVLSLGDVSPGEFAGDPDIAGAGVLGAFLCVTAASLLLALFSTGWWTLKNVGAWTKLSRQEKALKHWQLSIAGITEALITTCSDQQVFTGGAYAITLRYAKACSVSAYHYNIVANILLVTCATHLMAITTARHYWEQPLVGCLRIIVTTLVFVITGLLLAKQGSGSLGFPTEVPRDEDQYSPMLLPAACFQTTDSGIDKEISNAFKSGSADAFFTGQIHGWANYLIMFMFYVVAVCISLGRVIRRGRDKKGKRRAFVLWLRKVFPFFFGIKKLFYMVFALYLFAGIALSAWTVVIAGIYVFQLRRWVDQSNWMQKSSNGHNPENDPSTFGQLVPLLLMSLTLFTFLQIISQRFSARHKRARRLEYNALRNASNPNHPDHRRSDSDWRFPPPSSDTRYSTVSLVHGPPGDERPQFQDGDGLYDPHLTDKQQLKTDPVVVGVTAVENPSPIEIPIDDPPAPVPISRAKQQQEDLLPLSLPPPVVLADPTPTPDHPTNILPAVPTQEDTPQQPHPPSSSSPNPNPTSPSKPTLLERIARVRGEKRRKRRGGSDEAEASVQDTDTEGCRSTMSLPMPEFVHQNEGGRASAMSLPAPGLGTGAGARGRGEGSAVWGSGEWLAMGRSDSPAPVGEDEGQEGRRGG